MVHHNKPAWSIITHQHGPLQQTNMVHYNKPAWSTRTNQHDPLEQTSIRLTCNPLASLLRSGLVVLVGDLPDEVLEAVQLRLEGTDGVGTLRIVSRLRRLVGGRCHGD